MTDKLRFFVSTLSEAYVKLLFNDDPTWEGEFLGWYCRSMIRAKRDHLTPLLGHLSKAMRDLQEFIATFNTRLGPRAPSACSYPVHEPSRRGKLWFSCRWKLGHPKYLLHFAEPEWWQGRWASQYCIAACSDNAINYFRESKATLPGDGECYEYNVRAGDTYYWSDK